MNKGLILPIVNRIFFEEPVKKTKRKLTQTQRKFISDCKKYPIMGVYCEYSGNTPHYIGTVKIKNKNGDLDISSRGEYSWTSLEVSDISHYDKDKKCFVINENPKDYVKFFKEV